MRILGWSHFVNYRFERLSAFCAFNNRTTPEPRKVVELSLYCVQNREEMRLLSGLALALESGTQMPL